MTFWDKLWIIMSTVGPVALLVILLIVGLFIYTAVRFFVVSFKHQPHDKFSKDL